MKRRIGIAPIVVGLLIAVIALASVTTYLGVLAMQPRLTGNTGLQESSFPVVVSHPQMASAGTLGILSTSSSAVISSNTITVTGDAQVSYTPNEALLSLTVVTSNASAVAASTANAEAMSKVIRALDSIGITNSSIQTQGYSISPNYADNYDNNVPPEITGYTVSNSLQVNITSSTPAQLGSMVGKAIDAAVGAGANQVDLQFAATSSLQNTINTSALQAAVASASSQAQVIAKSLGVSVTGVVSATEGYSQPYGGWSYTTLNVAATAASSTPIIPGTQFNSASVTVVYSIG